MAIQSFYDQATEDFYVSGKIGKRVGWATVSNVALRKLDLLNYAHTLEDLKVPPANRLEALRGDLKGLFSIRVNDQWRVVFRWSAKGPSEVRIVDYHR